MNFEGLVASLERLGYRGMIRAIGDELADGQRSPAGPEFIRRARHLLTWLKTGIHPEALDDRDRRAYIRIATTLVARGEFLPSILEHLSALPGEPGAGPSAPGAAE